MNSCGQHSLAEIGFHGSSMKVGNAVAPALQLLLGGGIVGNGKGRISEKILKFPSRRAPAVLRVLLSDFGAKANAEETFNNYFDRVGKNHFYQLLRSFSDVSNILAEEFVDWNQENKFETAIGVGECAGVKIDLVSTLLLEAEEALELAKENLLVSRYADSIYKTYTVYIHAAKALLLTKGIHVNTQHGVLNDFEKEFVSGFREGVLQINRNKPEKTFAQNYFKEAQTFLKQVTMLRKEISQPILN